MLQLHVDSSQYNQSRYFLFYFTNLPARGLAEHSDLQRKNEKACIPCAGRDSDVCTSSNLGSVVSDSFDNYSPQDLLPHADATHSSQLSSCLYPPAQLPINGEAEPDQLLFHSGSSKHGITFYYYCFK